MSNVKIQGNASGTGTLTIAAPNTNSDRTLTLPDATGTVQVSGQPVSATTGTFSGTVSGGSTIGVGGATPSASGAGITFPATQNASSDANTLDDYEEGSFTLTLADSVGGAATMGGNNVWRYVKIGRTVTIAGTLDWTGTSALTAGSRIKLNGLPFTSDGSNANIRTACTVGSSSSGSCNIPTAQVRFGIDGGNTFIWGTNAGGNNVDTIMVKADLGNSGTIYGIVCTYLASA